MITTISLSLKEKKLLELLQQYQHPAIAFSGGADSSLLLAACRVAKVAAVPIMILSPMIPQFERQDAVKVAEETNFQLTTLEIKPLEDAKISANDSKRCYYCKQLLMTTIKAEASRLGCDVLFDGTNVDDQGDYRPGQQAVQELGVVSPLLICGFTKKDIRELGNKLKLSVANKPAYACLASRIAYGEQITVTKLAQIEKAEDYLRSLGLEGVRVRLHGSLARIEVAPSYIPLVASGLKDQIAIQLKEIGFSYVVLDLEGYRTGSMNTAIK